MNDPLDKIAYDHAQEALDIANRIRPLLAGNHADVQGAALAELVATWLAGHNPVLRELMLKDWIGAVRELIPIAEKHAFGSAGFPQHRH